ncbi:MAG: hypothetical protein ACM3PZ_00235 [Bacillota bacterium]
MKIFKISEEIVPLSRRQQAVLALIITLVFQFLLFFAPVLAAEAVEQDRIQTVKVEATKGEADPVVAALISEVQASPLPVEEIASTPEPTVQPEAETVKVIRTSTHVMTAYNSEAAQTDGSPCITANGFNVCEHGTEDTIAANFLKFGTKVRIPDLYGDRIFVVRDRMNKRYSDRVDIWMVHKADALKFGVRTAKIEVVEVIE